MSVEGSTERLAFMSSRLKRPFAEASRSTNSLPYISSERRLLSTRAMSFPDMVRSTAMSEKTRASTLPSSVTGLRFMP